MCFLFFFIKNGCFLHNSIILLFFFFLVVEKVSSLSGSVVAAVSSRRESGTADQSQSNPGEGTTQEPPEP